MSYRRILIIGIISVGIILALLVSQFLWMKQAYALQMDLFESQVTKALKNIVVELYKNKEDAGIILDPVEKESTNLYKVSINDTLPPYYLQSLLINEFRKQEINLNFEYSIYDCFTDSVVYNQVVQYTAVKSDEEKPSIAWEKDGHYFGVYFPEVNPHIYKKMRFLILSSTLVVVLMLLFILLMAILFRQRRLSETTRDFINNMTHELKTPISTISISSERLLRPGIEKDPERLQRFASIIFQENKRLYLQVDRILKSSLLDKPTFHLNLETLSFKKEVSEVIQSIDLQLQNKNLSIEEEYKATKDKIQADPVHLKNIMLNLLENAIKYTPEGRKLFITTFNQEGKLVCEIKDEGIGISKKHISHIFDRFYRVPKGDRYDETGFGLGLYYVKKYVEAHKGQIKCKSEVGKGTTFILSFPLSIKIKENDPQN